MSENQLIQRSEKKIEEEEDEYEYAPIIDIFEPEFISQPKVEEKLRKFYYPLEFPFCGDYQQPDLKEVEEKKKRIGLPFAENNEHREKQKLISLDGTFEESVEIDPASPEIIRLKTRMARDGREEFFQKTGEFILEKEFFQEQMARLANISFEENLAIKTFHKNAILSERNNQKKSTSFQLVINFGGIFINKHPLQNEEEKKFEEIKPLMKEWAILSTYPVLPELSKEIDYLKEMREIIAENVGSTRGRDELFDIEKKLRICEDLYEKERRRIEEVARGIISKWKEVKDIRTSTGLTTVPWKINIKEYEVNDEVEGRMIKNFDIGMIPFEIERLDMNQSQLAINEKTRRSFIQEEKYFLKVIINGNEVARTEKFFLQWPSYKVPIHEQLSITVYSAPYQVAVQIVKSGFINQVIDTVNLSLPGANSRTITASEKKFAIASFASNGKETRNKKEKEEAKAPAGNVLYMMEWKGQGSRMPPSIFAKVGEEDTESTEVSEGLTDRLSDLDITEKEIKGLFDAKDPREQQKSIKEKVEDEINQGTNALLPFSHVQSTRLLFLRLRNQISDLEKIQIPLLEEEFDKREDLREILEREKRKNKTEIETQNHKYFHPCENKYFNEQEKSVLEDIRSLLGKIEGLKLFNSSRGLNLSSIKYKIAEEIINEHIFEQMESPIVIFFKDLFTQKRKLGPKSTYKAMPRLNFDDFEINIHVRNARNMPIRSNAEESINQFEKAEKMMGGMMAMGMGMGMNMGMNQGMGMGMGMGGGGMYPQAGGMFSNNRDMYSNYGAGLFNMRPIFTMTGHTFFTQNQNNPNRINQEASYEGKSMERVNTVVELKFKKIVKRTTSFEGPFPEWNETLAFKYEIKKENSSIEKIFYNNEKLMKLLVYDITEESKPTNAIAKIEIKKTKYYIGRIEIPFSLVTIIPSLTGIWKLERPLVMFSYGIMKKEILGNDMQGGENGLNNNEPRSDIPTLLNIDMFTEPLIDSFIAYNTDRKFIVGPEENPLLLQKASDWLEDLNTKRFVKLWLNDINQKSIFICRYLSKNVAPPKFEFNPIEKAARFVSLIPRKYNCQLLQNTEEFHLNADEFLKLKMGEDHGILLCNYFNYIDAKNHPSYESYLILCKSFPYGKSIFVLRRDKETNNCEIWDPFKGDCYVFPGKEYEISCFCIKTEKKQEINYSGQNICPLFEATCIVGRDNVYVNKQESTNPYLLDFTLEDDGLWAAFLSDREIFLNKIRTRTEYFTSKEIPTIQPEIDENYYTETFPESKEIPADIEKGLYEYIRSKMEEQRKNHFTPLVFKLNQKVSKKISETLLLQQCETFKSDFRMTGKDSKMYESSQLYYTGLKQLEEQKNNITNTILDSDKNLYGFTMNFTFTTFEEIWEKIEDTQVHLDENQNIEFVLSVKCFPYTCQLFSVWVFIGSIQ